MHTDPNTFDGTISLNDVRARIMRMPANLRHALPDGTKSLQLSYQQGKTIDCSIGSEGTWVSGVTPLFRDVGVLRGSKGELEARIATITWSHEPSTAAARLTITPHGGWVNIGKDADAPEANGSELSVEATWEGYLAEARADSDWLDALGELREERPRAVEEMRALLDEFLRGLSLVEFCARFDRSARNDWGTFRLGGFSFGMFANKLVKHLGDDRELPDVLRGALRVPGDTDQASAQLNRLLSFLTARVESTSVTERDVSPGYVPAFLSCWWHVQAADRWAINYHDVRTALFRFAGLDRVTDRVEKYLSFNRRFYELAEHLALDSWELEHLCRHLAEESDLGGKTSTQDTDTEPSIWLVQPGEQARLWEQCRQNGEIVIGWDNLGDLRQYASRPAVVDALQKVLDTEKKKVNDAAACHDFAFEMKPGDLILAKKGRSRILGCGRIASDYRYEPEREEYHHVRNVEWTAFGPWDLDGQSLVLKTLTDISNYPVLLQTLHELTGLEFGPVVEEGDDAPEPSSPAISVADAASEAFMPSSQLEKTVGLLRRKKNIILKGPPGTGKTFLAQWLSYLLMGEKDSRRITTVQFHQSYAYEDFVQGYRPAKDGSWVLKNGPFIELCKRAEADQERPYVLIIDEINRGNISRILGELLMLLEGDKRQKKWATTLAYAEGDTRFFVPPNVHVIGTMNTADRSLAVVDYALRRRFAFVDVDPGFDSPGFRSHLQGRGVDDVLIDHIQQCLGSLNAMIGKDPSLGAGFKVGHSYFCDPPRNKEDWYSEVIDYEILPLLDEYWFDDASKVETASKLLSEPPS